MGCHTILSSYTAAATTTAATFSFTSTLTTTTAATPSQFSTSVSFQTRPMKPLFGSSFRTRAVITEDMIISKPVTEMSFYELLGIPETGTLPEIKQAYKRLARVYHPDVSPPERVKEHTERFIRIQDAYETLSDPNRRALYDFNQSCGLHLAFSAKNNVYPGDHEVKFLEFILFFSVFLTL
ncbi:hypothetical protein RND81_14G050200 [Saponaria officinalis]|uniref:J domain-containing protein n=1 Tax=Saponaria officinalis TaxID=3572 RepID=A0AAW1GL69_SAPOF